MIVDKEVEKKNKRKTPEWLRSMCIESKMWAPDSFQKYDAMECGIDAPIIIITECYRFKRNELNGFLHAPGSALFSLSSSNLAWRLSCS